jgi:anthranilate phosphoribosyltransferase
MAFSVSQALNRFVDHEDLTHEEMLDVMRQIMSGQVSAVLIAAMLTALRVKVETTTEIAAAAQVMREFATHVDLQVPHLVDICGTGGDNANTFNISTSAMFVAAAAGARVAKHGGRSVSSQSGSADLLELLGADIHLKPKDIAASVQKTGVGFMFAPNHHLAMKHIAPVRKELGVRTIFNILGPLTNPAGAKRQLMGVFHSDLVAIQAEVLRKLGSEHVIIVNARSGLDELALNGETLVAELKLSHIQHYSVTAQQFGFPNYSVYELADGLCANSLEESKARLFSALNNEIGPARDIVAFNAAGALLAADVVDTWQAGVDLALATIASGAAKRTLEEFVAVTQALAKAASKDA